MSAVLLAVPLAAPSQAVRADAFSFGQDSLCYFSATPIVTTNCIFLSGGVQVTAVAGATGVMFCSAVAPGAVTVTVSCVTGTGVSASATLEGAAFASREDDDDPFANSADICVTATADWNSPLDGTFSLHRCFEGKYVDVSG